MIPNDLQFHWHQRSFSFCEVVLRRSRRCAAAGTCRTPGRCRAERGREGSGAGTVGPPAGERTATRRARWQARRRTRSRRVQQRKQERRPAGFGWVRLARVPESRRLEAQQAQSVRSARNHPLRLPPPFGCFLLPPFALSPSGNTRKAPPLQPAGGRRPRAKPDGCWSTAHTGVPASTSDPPRGSRYFPAALSPTTSLPTPPPKTSGAR